MMRERLTPNYEELVRQLKSCVFTVIYPELAGSAATAIQLLTERLAYYEDLEEQGRLAVLPCKVGDTVYTNCAMSGWYFRAKDRPYPAKVVFYGLNGSEDMGGGLFNVVYEKHDYMMQFRFSDIGKTVFLTREEAEKALKEAPK